MTQGARIKWVLGVVVANAAVLIAACAFAGARWRRAEAELGAAAGELRAARGEVDALRASLEAARAGLEAARAGFEERRAEPRAAVESQLTQTLTLLVAEQQRLALQPLLRPAARAPRTRRRPSRACTLKP